MKDNVIDFKAAKERREKAKAKEGFASPIDNPFITLGAAVAAALLTLWISKQ